jgi:hypothetical protein
MTLITTFFNQLCHRQWAVWTCTNPVNMVFSLEASVFMMEWVFYWGGVYTEKVKYKFVEVFPISHIPHLNILQWLTQSFREAGSVSDVLTTGRPWVLTMDEVLNISDCIMQSLEETVTASRHLIFINTENTYKSHLHPCMKHRNVTCSGVCNIVDGLETSLPLMKIIFWTLHF